MLHNNIQSTAELPKAPLLKANCFNPERYNSICIHATHIYIDLLFYAH